MEQVWISRAGRVPYEAARAAQKRLERARQTGAIPDLLLLLEHPPVYTRGRRSEPSELPMGVEWYETQGIEVCDTDRGGRVTYHGPGQLVGYPIVSLAPYGGDVHDYIRRMETVIVSSLQAWGVESGTLESLTGVWTKGPPPGSGVEAEARKIGSIGVHVSRGVTTHGFAINVNNDLQPFEWIVPCGIEGCRITSLGRELGAEQDLDAFAATVEEEFCATYGREPVHLSPAELAGRVNGTGALAGARRPIPLAS